MCITSVDFMQIVSALSAKANKGMIPIMNCIYCNTIHYSEAAWQKPNSITLSSSLAGRRPVRNQIPLHCPACDQLASRSVTSSRAGSRAAREMVEDLRVHVVCVSQAKFHYVVQLPTSSAREMVAEKDNVMEYGLNRSATRFELSRHVEIARTSMRMRCAHPAGK